MMFFVYCFRAIIALGLILMMVPIAVCCVMCTLFSIIKGAISAK